MKRLYLLLLLIVSLYSVNSQTIKGYLFSGNKKPVEFANVILLNLPDSSYEAGSVSYTDGQYTFDRLKPGKYYIKASCMGFQDKAKEIDLAEGTDIQWVDTIFLQEKINELSEVEVTGHVIKAKELVDRTVYEIPAELEKISTNGYDVLKKIPSVQVDFNNNITLNGKSNFIVQVDGKQRSSEFLARLLPSDIESIEIIHNPSGKYEGDIEGVINVIIKKEARVGINGNFGIQSKPWKKPTIGAMASLDYGLEKITFYVSGYSFIQRLVNNTDNYNRYSIPLKEADSIVNLSGKGSFNMSVSSINTGFDYYLNDKNTISVNYSFKPNIFENEIKNNGNIYLIDSLVNYQDNATNTNNTSGESNISFFYRKKFKKPIQELTVETNYYFFNSEDNNDFTNYLYEDDHITELFSNNRDENTDNNRKYFSNKIDFVQPIGVTMRFEAGYQLYYQHMDYDFESNNEQFNNVYKYSEFRNAAYTSFMWNLKNFGFQGTVRIEDSNIEINEKISSHYTTILPSTNIQYKLNNKQNLKFTYNRRINRPGIYNLNPFEKINGDLSISAGNPYLKPEYRDKLQLTYTLNFKSNFISPYVYYEIFSNKIDNKVNYKRSPLTGNNALFNSPENILTGFEKGIGLNAMLWSFNINGSIYSGHFDKYSDSLYTIESKNYSSYRITTYVYAPMFKKKINAFAMFSYDGATINAQSKSYHPLMYGFGANKIIKNHTFGFFYLLPLSKEIVFNKTITETPVIYSENISSFDVSWFIQVMYSYKFNKGRAVKKSNRQVDVESDTKGGGLK